MIHPKARLAEGVRAGPYTVVDGEVEIGPGCELGPHVYITGWTRIGAGNRFHAGAVIGDWPQDVRFRGGQTGVLIGDNNIFREHVTVHRSNDPEEPTRIGSNNLLMAHSHAGHNCQVGDHVILANGALLAGHVAVEDRAFISGNCMVHQFTRVGMLALMQGGSGISKDLPPFTIARGHNGMAGLNVVGLRRAGAGAEERLELRRLYHLLFRSGKRLAEGIAEAEAQAASNRGRALVRFLKSGRRGFCADVSRKGGREEARGYDLPRDF